MKNRFAAMAALLLMVMTMPVVISAAAGAASVCDGSLSDTTVFGPDSAITTIVGDFAGADVHVLTYQGSASPANYMRSTINGCEGWQDDSGQLPSNGLVFALNKTTFQGDVLYGDHWVPAFQDSDNYQRLWGNFSIAPQYQSEPGPLFEARIGLTVTHIIPGT